MDGNYNNFFARAGQYSGPRSSQNNNDDSSSNNNGRISHPLYPSPDEAAFASAALPHAAAGATLRNDNLGTGYYYASPASSNLSLIVAATALLPLSTLPLFPPPPAPTEDLSQLPYLRARVRQHVQRVIECLPQEQSQAYHQAIEKDALLVQTETDPVQFVRYCEYDVYAGAKRLCHYWNERLSLFGPERAFLPLVLTGTGALTTEDLLPLRAGFPSLLPDTTTGRSCIFFDRRNLVPNVKTENLLRSCFFAFKVLAENDITQLDGAVILAATATPRSKGVQDVDWDYVRRCSALLSQCFPVKSTIHLISVPQQKKPVFAAKIVDAFVRVLQHYFRFTGGWSPSGNQDSAGNSNASNNCRHVFRVLVQTPDDEKTKILDELLAMGLTRKGIPHTYEGDWLQQDFLDWCQERMELEEETYKDRLMDKATAGVVGEMSWNRAPKGVVVKSPPAAVASSSSEAVAAAAAAPASSDEGHDGIIAPSTKCARKGQLKSVRGGSPGTKTNDDSSPAHLGAELPTSPPVAAAAVLSEEERKAKRRMEDLIRSRRKRERQRIEFEGLKEDSSRLVEENRRLVAERDRLNGLLLEAEQCVADLSASSQQQGYRGLL
ncbi:hypothetical protein ACA910_002148 [Epithemia clementina (nom. ined.)]